MMRRLRVWDKAWQLRYNTALHVRLSAYACSFSLLSQAVKSTQRSLS